MKKLMLPLTISLCVGVIAACDTADEENYQAAQVPEETTRVVFADLDTDRDQALTRVEADRVTSLDAVFDDLDNNDDNRLSSEEFAAISEWEGDLDSDQYAVVTAMTTYTTPVDETATASRFDQNTGLEQDRGDLRTDRNADVYDSDWPRTGDNTMADVDTDVESDFQQLDPEEDSRLDRQDRTAGTQGDSAYQLDSETDTTTAMTDQSMTDQSMTDQSMTDQSGDFSMGAESEMAAEGDRTAMESELGSESSISLADVRVTEEPTLELMNGDAPEVADQRVTQSVFQTADADGDNQLAREEAVEIEGLAAVFADLDEDGDGALALSEFESINNVS